jgi:hypothetical protein
VLQSDILEDDKRELKELKKQYISATAEDKTALEEEIIDTIFFLEEDEVADGV